MKYLRHATNLTTLLLFKRCPMSNSPLSKRSKFAMVNGNYTGPSSAYIQVVQNGCFGRGGCVFLFTSTAGYLFNAPEGTERVLCEHGVRNSRMKNIFFTSADWTNLSGLNGLIISLRKSGAANVKLHGVPGVSGMIRGAEHVSDQAGPPLKIKDCADGENYEDENIWVKCIKLKNDSCVGNALGPNAYFVRVKQKNPKLLLEKCLELAVPVGPVLGQLQAGKDVTLADGRRILAADVLERPEPSPTFLVLECTDSGCLGNFSNASWALDLLQSDERLNAVVHFTNAELFESSIYKRWISCFGDKTRHVVFSDHLASCVPHSEASFRFNIQMNHVNGALFPLLHTSHNYKECKESPSEPGSVLVAKPWLRINFRPNAGSVEQCTPLLEPEEILSPLKADPILRDQLSSLDTVPLVNNSYPAVTFLGTSSATPVRTRNVSGLLIHLSEDEAMLCDCGESTYQQICIRHKAEEALALLRSIKLIYISHTHADHVFGLPTMLIKRRRAFVDCGKDYEPVYLIAPRMLSKIMDLFTRYTGRLEDLYLPIYTHKLLPMGEECLRRLDEVKRLLSLRRLTCVPVAHPMGAHGLIVTSQEGKTLVYSGDTRPCQELIRAGSEADLLIHEATMEDDLTEEACLKQHSTISEAIGVGQAMGARFTMLTHFSGRYSKLPVVDAKYADAPVFVAFDFMRVSLEQTAGLPSILPILKHVFREYYDEMLQRTERSILRKNLMSMNTSAL